MIHGLQNHKVNIDSLGQYETKTKARYKIKFYIIEYVFHVCFSSNKLTNI